MKVSALAKRMSALAPRMVGTRLASRCSLVLIVAGSSVGCGRPATEDECRMILRRAAELELRERIGADADLIESEVASLQESMHDTMMNKCVGKRITERALSCVRKAESSEELFKKCFR